MKLIDHVVRDSANAILTRVSNVRAGALAAQPICQGGYVINHAKPKRAMGRNDRAFCDRAFYDGHNLIQTPMTTRLFRPIASADWACPTIENGKNNFADGDTQPESIV